MKFVISNPRITTARAAELPAFIRLLLHPQIPFVGILNIRNSKISQSDFQNSFYKISRINTKSKECLIIFRNGNRLYRLTELHLPKRISFPVKNQYRL